MPVGQPKTGRSWWRGLTECGPLEKGKLSQELSSLREKIYSYINRKRKQSNNLNQMSNNKFKDAFNNKTYDEVENDIDNKFNDYLNSNESNWDNYRNKNLSPDEIKFDKRNRGN